MSANYYFAHYNGTAALQLLPHEQDGDFNKSTPREIVNIVIDPNTGVNYLITNDDLTTQFIPGFQFEIVGTESSYNGTYTVAPTGSVATTHNDKVVTRIPIVEPLGFVTSNLVHVDAVNNILYVQSESACRFRPSSEIVIADNTNVPSNGTYHVDSAESSGHYQVVGANPSGNTWSILGDYARFFVPAKTFTLTGHDSLPEMNFTTISALFDGSVTVIAVVEPIPPGTLGSGVITPNPVLTLVTPVEVIDVATASDGTVSSEPPSSYDISVDNPSIQPIGGGLYHVTFFTPGNITAEINQYIDTQCPGLIKDNNVLAFNYVNFVSASYASGPDRTTFTVEFMTTGAYPLIEAGGVLVLPGLDIHYGFIQYERPNPATSLYLIGKGSPNYNNTMSWGNAIQNNLIFLLENFAGDNEPTSPVIGQQWFDTATPQLWLRDETETWRGVIATTIPAADYVDMGGNQIKNMNDPTDPMDAVNYQFAEITYVNVVGDTMTGDLTLTDGASLIIDDAAGNIELFGGDFELNNDSSILFLGTGIIDMGGNQIKMMADPTDPQDAVNLQYAELTYVNVTGDTMTGDLVMDAAASIEFTGTGIIDMGGNQIKNLDDPTDPMDAVNLQYADDTYVDVTGDTMTGDLVMDAAASIEFTGTGVIDMGDNQIKMVADPTDLQDAVNLQYADDAYVNVTGDTMTGDLTLTDGASLIIDDADGNIEIFGGDFELNNDSSIKFIGTGTIDMNVNKITNVHAPESALDAANKAYVDSLTSGIIWVQPVNDPNMFDDSTGTPPALPDENVSFARTYVVKPNQYTITNVTTGTNGIWTLSGTFTNGPFAPGDTFTVAGNDDPASNATYTVITAVDNAGDLDVEVADIPVGATVSGSVYHSYDDWNGLEGHAVTHDPFNNEWISVLDRPVAPSDRFGVFVDPNNNDVPLADLATGGLTGHDGKIAIVSAVDPTTFAVTWSFYTPAEPDAFSVNGSHSPHIGSSYTFRGTHGSGTYGDDYAWIEFAGPTAVNDGAGLNYAGNVLFVGQGTGITVGDNSVGLDLAYMNSNYTKLDKTNDLVQIKNDSTFALTDNKALVSGVAAVLMPDTLPVGFSVEIRGLPTTVAVDGTQTLESLGSNTTVSANGSAKLVHVSSGVWWLSGDLE